MSFHGTRYKTGDRKMQKIGLNICVVHTYVLNSCPSVLVLYCQQMAVLTVRIVGHEERREQQGGQSPRAVYPCERARRGVVPPTQGLLVHLVHAAVVADTYGGMVRYGGQESTYFGVV